jgi:hypothetical protein
MSETCGCCEGIRELTPETRLNRPGLSALRYRVGTHGSFLETMKARLSNLELTREDLGGTGNEGDRFRPLRDLTTRDESDPAIALLDAWAMVGDVLTFYQERFANEGFLITATERRSVLELARLIGYRLRPGVAASVFLAYTLEKDYAVEIPAGARVQSVPGPGELPQSFETSDKLAARFEWNSLKPRVTRPQIITLDSDYGTDAATRETLYFDGVSTKLTAGDALLIRLSDEEGQQVLRLVEAVDAQASYDRTEVRLQQPITTSGSIDLEALLGPFIDDASNLFAGTSIASEVVKALQGLVDVQSSTSLHDAVLLLAKAQVRLEELHDLALKRKFTRLEPWIDEVRKTVQTIRPSALIRDAASGGGVVVTVGHPEAAEAQLSGFGNLFALLQPLSLAASRQPATSLQLLRSSARTFAAQSDIAPQLLTALNPAVAPVLYRAWSMIEVPSSKVKVDAIRVKAGFFPGTFPGKATVTTGHTDFQALTFFNSWPVLVVSATDQQAPSAILLDAVYDKIQPDSWVTIDRPPVAGEVGRQLTFHKVIGAQTRVASVQANPPASDGYASKVTQLTLDPPWLDSLTNRSTVLGSIEVLHGTVVYAQAEPLALVAEPLDRDVAGNTIELDELYAGLNSGRWIIVSGERTDIPNVSGITASELVMLAGVTQGEPKEDCVTFPTNAGGRKVPPFSQVFYVTEPSFANDRLVVGTLQPEVLNRLKSLPQPSVTNQQYCEPVELAPGLIADAYVPTQDEIKGKFPAFERLLRDPFPGSLGDDDNPRGVFGWRIKSPNEAHTTLQLANQLAYSYDAATVKIYGNVVKATQGETKNEVLGSGDGSQELQQFTLLQSPLTYLAAPTPAGADSTLQVRINDVLWHETDSLVGLGPKDRRYITSADDKDQTSVEFGDGKSGARLPTGVENVKAVYRVGIGASGNVKAKQITSVVTKPLGVKEVVNPLPASGGAGREELDQARRNAPLAVMALDRLISVQDYADFARAYAGIAKSGATKLSDGRRQLVHLTIAGSDDIPIDTTSDLYLNLRRALLRSGDPYQSLQLGLRKLKLMVISAQVRLLPDYLWESVEPKIRAALLDKFSFLRRELGQNAFPSEAQSVIQAQTGVAYVDLDVFDTVNEDTSPQELANLGTTLKLQRYIVVNSARVDRNADDGSKRILPAELAYLNPAVADTLILTEVSG